MERGNSRFVATQGKLSRFKPQWWNVDTPDLGSGAGDCVRVRVPPEVLQDTY